jgi:hypothetical protein
MQLFCLVRSSCNSCRIHVQDAIRRQSRDPRDEDEKRLEQLQESLRAQLTVLETMQQDIAGVLRPSIIIQDNQSQFDDIDDEELGHGAEDIRSDEAGAAPFRPPRMPSTCDGSDRIHQAIELTLRRQQAGRLLSALREAIADKSFQYSHVLRVAPGKTIRNRARAGIKKLNDVISFHCRAYNKCRSAMIQLGAEPQILSKYPVLQKQDVKASTALLNPNIPGSSTLRLSWIWQTGLSQEEQSPEALRECREHISFFARCSHSHDSPACTLVASSCTEGAMG